VFKSSHDLIGFILVVVGQAGFPQGLHVSIHSHEGSIVLSSAARGRL
jgi:hypothetical protein